VNSLTNDCLRDRTELQFVFEIDMRAQRPQSRSLDLGVSKEQSTKPTSLIEAGIGTLSELQEPELVKRDPRKYLTRRDHFSMNLKVLACETSNLSYHLVRIGSQIARTDSKDLAETLTNLSRALEKISILCGHAIATLNFVCGGSALDLGTTTTTSTSALFSLERCFQNLTDFYTLCEAFGPIRGTTLKRQTKIRLHGWFRQNCEIRSISSKLDLDSFGSHLHDAESCILNSLSNFRDVKLPTGAPLSLNQRA
jgi:hypothetical protein